MKFPAVLCASLLLALTLSPSAHAKGCIIGALVGGAAGHFAGHHGLLGAAAGCLIGRHEAKKHAREEERARAQSANK